jgi:NhaP-type Na+/H+ or K+/H+ antiporter
MRPLHWNVVELDFDTDLGLGLIALAVALYGMVAVTLTRFSVSAAFAFLVIGAIIGGAGAGILVSDLPDLASLSFLAEVTLALVLFSAASTVRLKRLELDSSIVGRLLVIGLPLTIAAGTAVALGLFPGITFGLALLIGTILAPTDADLGHQVITDTSVPARVRRVLNVESGLNDGIVAPVVTVAIALAVVGDVSGMNPVLDAVWELGLAIIIGVVIGGVGRRLLIRADIRHTASTSSRQLSTLALAMAAFFMASAFDSSGFIATFAAGLAYGMGNKERVESAVSFTEAQSVLLSIAVWLVFGLIVVSEHVLRITDPAVIAYVVLSLTLIRMVPVALALLGTRFDRVSVAFMGWFGPRGLASVVFGILALEALEGAGVSSDPLGPVLVGTVTLSVILHGFSARPLAGWYGRYTETLPEDSPEHLGEVEPRRPAWTVHGHRVPGA